MNLAKIKEAFDKGTLKVQSISPEGQIVWKRVLDVQRSQVGPESILEVTTNKGPMVVTGGHRVFLSPTLKTESENLKRGMEVQGALKGVACKCEVRDVQRLPNRAFMYDLTAEDWHNFVLHRSKTVVSNSPDRNYHFRPPSSQDALSKQTRVFGYIWEDAEMLEALERGLDTVNLYPPQTAFNIATLPRNWTTITLTAAGIWALTALSINWVSEEFSVGGEETLELLLPDESKVTVTFEELYEIIGNAALMDLFLSSLKKATIDEGALIESTLIQKAYLNGDLKVKSVSPEGEIQWRPLSNVTMHDTSKKEIFEVSTKEGTCNVTGDHSLFVIKDGGPVPIRTEDLTGHSLIVSVKDDQVMESSLSIIRADSRDYMYDITVPGNESFVLALSGILAHNSYSIGGVSLDIDKSSKYQGLMESLQSRFEQMIEQAHLTIKITRGLQQPRFGVGIHGSQLGPYLGGSAWSVRNFTRY